MPKKETPLSHITHLLFSPSDTLTIRLPLSWLLIQWSRAYLATLHLQSHLRSSVMTPTPTNPAQSSARPCSNSVGSITWNAGCANVSTGSSTSSLVFSNSPRTSLQGYHDPGPTSILQTILTIAATYLPSPMTHTHLIPKTYPFTSWDSMPKLPTGIHITPPPPISWSPAWSDSRHLHSSTPLPLPMNMVGLYSPLSLITSIACYRLASTENWMGSSFQWLNSCRCCGGTSHWW